eukprot:TRINITY_DN17650_c1_g6_i2.p1 TRINITY_DN17650_c1_g6~~TRINITY_DN17650_c1_g6_i2.p1  ORF type:complete len:177 (-),score=26.72 TRINITY_DN17650_c1_g6_i2:310-840(-)
MDDERWTPSISASSRGVTPSETSTPLPPAGFTRGFTTALSSMTSAESLCMDSAVSSAGTQAFRGDGTTGKWPSSTNQVEHLGRVSLAHLDMRAHLELTAFREFCAQKFGSLEATWKTIIKYCVESNMNARIREVSFVHAATQMGFQGDVGLVFTACDVEREHMVCMQNLEFLRIGL